MSDSDLFTTEELRDAGSTLPSGKAPGPNGVPDEVLRVIVQVRPLFLLPTFNKCLSTGNFFKSWKAALLVLLQKVNKPLELTSSYRPLCLMDSVGKLFEILLKARIQGHLHRQPEGIAAQQFGFTKGRSTTQAIEKVMSIVVRASSGQLYNRKLCALASLDVANAFNTVSWCKIDAALVQKRLPDYVVRILRSYLDGRSIIVGERRRSVTSVVPQGSVIGPTLWNIFYDGLMRIGFPPEVEIVCFADDASIIATTGLLEEAMNDALEMVAKWIQEQGLTISRYKSAATMLTTKRDNAKPRFIMSGVEIELKESIRYLGVELCSVLGFRKHIEVVCNKAAKTASALARLMPNVGGPSPEKRRLLTTVVNSQLLYAAPIWHGALNYQHNRKTISSPQRKMTLRIASAYRTVNNDAVMLMAGIVPIHLLANERTSSEQ